MISSAVLPASVSSPDLAHLLAGRELADNRGRGPHGDGIDDPQRLDARDQALRPALLEQLP
jgi:hypothetical protein